MTCQPEHLPECSAGWVDVPGPDGESRGFRPCEVCMPGKYAVYKAGYDLSKDHWRRDQDARRIYNAGQEKAGKAKMEEATTKASQRRLKEAEEDYE